MPTGSALRAGRSLPRAPGGISIVSQSGNIGVGFAIPIDQARVIAAILQNPGPHDRQIYPLYGDKELSYYEIAAKVQETLGIPVRYEPIDIPTFAAGLVAAGVSPFRVQHVSSVAQDYLDGVFSGTNNLVEVIGGTKPRTIEDSVAATRSLFETDGVYGITDARLRAA